MKNCIHFLSPHHLISIKILILLVSIFANGPAYSKSLNGFKLDGASVPIEEIKSGGPPRDGISSIDRPRFIKARVFKKKYKQDSHYNEKSKALVITYKNMRRAYPIAILNWHEIVNDKIRGNPIAVTWCPLSGTGMVFKSKNSLVFGVSGLLYNSNVLMYDKKTDALWSQIKMEAVTGKHKGKKLELLKSDILPLFEFVDSYPDADILSHDTSSKKPYGENPYRGYSTSENLYFDIKKLDGNEPIKTWSALIKGEKDSVILPMTKAKNGGNRLNIEGEKIEIEANKDKSILSCKDVPDKFDCLTGYWFALKAFYPDSKIPKLDGFKSINEYK